MDTPPGDLPAELCGRLDELFASFNGLCQALTRTETHLDTLMEFNKLVQDELKYVNDMEDVEYTRDWSQPRKLRSSELIQHKQNVELTLSHKAKKVAYIVSFAERMTESAHPASAELAVYVSTLRTEVTRLAQLMTVLGEHIQRLQQFEQFFKDHDELNSFLHAADHKFQHFSSLLASKLNSKTQTWVIGK